jgi:hypothetical protein
VYLSPRRPRSILLSVETGYFHGLVVSALLQLTELASQ